MTTAAAGLGTALVVPAPSAQARPPAAATADATADATHTLRSPELEVVVDTRFPRVVRYTDRARDLELPAQSEEPGPVLIDGTAHTPTATSRVVDDDRIRYTLTFDGGTEIDAEIQVEGWRTHWRVTDVRETTALRVGTLRVPDLVLLAVHSDHPAATLLAARVELDKNADGDTLVEVTDRTAEYDPTGCAYAVLATGELGAAIETNTVWDRPTADEGTEWENGRLWHRIARHGDRVEARVSPGQWTLRAEGADKDDTEPLPYATVILTDDRNDDGVVDWQDAAIAMRDVMVNPRGADRQHLRVVSHIPFNFASQATNPFLATLDEVKRIHLATDGLGQFTLLKGYGAEGHDSAHPDYGGHYNARAGGLDDLNTLVRVGRQWNSDFAVHVNATESYPEAHAFSEELVDVADEQWDWLNQSYRIDARRDLNSGDVIDRFRLLREETDEALNSLYIDVFRESGANSDRLQRALDRQGWTITTEWGHGLERSAVWSHWATETDYGGDESRGVNSRLIRFVRHHQKDVFADRWPTLLGHARIRDYEGWLGKTDWHAFHEVIWNQNLPAKYLQAQPIRTWDTHEITFFGEARTVVTDADGTRTVTTDGKQVLRGDSYLLPWEPRGALNPDRLYHHNATGGRTTWELPRGWADEQRVTVFPLTPQGRGAGVEVPVEDGRVTLDADAGQPYVVHRPGAAGTPDPAWGEGTSLVNPGFHAGDLTGWQAGGPVSVVSSELGDEELVVAAGAAARVSQRLTRLRPGDYWASAQVEVGASAGERRRAALRVRTADGVTSENWADTSTAVNHVAADRKHGTRFQRMFTRFTVPAGGGFTTLSLTAERGEARVRFDRVRVVPASGEPPLLEPGELLREDFEHVPQGWGPFVAGDSGGANDPRTHLARRNSPYTQRGWRGKAIDDVLDGTWSLKSRGERDGDRDALVYRTVPHTVRFRPGRRYLISFRYENELAGEYAWVTGVDTPEPTELLRADLPRRTEPTEHSYEWTAPADGEGWVGLRRTGTTDTAEFALDTFSVRELD